MVNLTAASLAALVLIFILTVVHGIDDSGREMGGANSNYDRSQWSQDGRVSGNDMMNGDETMADLLKVNPWAFYPNQGKLTFARESRNYQPRSGRDEESQFTETSRSPPFAPRLGRVLHYSPRFRRITLN